MSNVKSVVQREKGALIHLEDGSKPIWTPEYELAVALIGKPIPENWTQKEGPLGPQALPPKKGGGGFSAWRNTKEGFEAETRGRQRWQEIEEEKRDRRTALMQAVAWYGSGDEIGVPHVLDAADDFYAWLRSSLAPGGQEATNAAQGPAQAVPGLSQTSPAVGSKTLHAGGAGSAPATPGSVGDTSSPSSGEAAASSVEPGEGRSSSGDERLNAQPEPSLGSTRPTPTYPVSPEECNHKFGTTGNWLKHCPRCGMSALLYRESDVGP